MAVTTLVSSPITINSGQSQATSNVTIYGDTTAEDNETVCIDISSVTNGIEDGTQQARLTILLNDDAAGPVLDNATPSEQQIRSTGRPTPMLQATPSIGRPPVE